MRQNQHFFRLTKNLKAGILLPALLLLLTGNAWAGSSNKNYYSKVTLSKTGSGKVYCQKDGTSGTWTENGATSAADSQSSAPSHTWYIKAEPESGWAFKEWNTFSGWTQQPTASNSQTNGTIKAGESATEAKATAVFVKVFQFKAKADFMSNSASGGKVWVSFENTTPSYQTTAMTATGTQNGTSTSDANATKTAYFNAQAPTGMEFRGWYSDAAGTTLVSSNTSVTPTVTSTVNSEPSTPQLTYYAKFEKVETTPSWALSGVAGTSKTLEIGETIGLVTDASNTPSWGTPTYVDAGETNPVMTYNASTKTFTANRAGQVTVTFTQTAGEDANGVLWKAGSETFTFTVEKCTPAFAWADPLPNFVVGTSLQVSDLFSFTPAECEQNWTLTSSDPTNLPSITSSSSTLSLPKEVNGVTLTFHQDATWKWKEIANTSIRINVTKEPVTFNWKNPALIAGNTYAWTDFVETNSEGAWNLVSDDETVIPTMRSIANTSGTVAAGTVTLTFTQGQDLGHDAVSVQTHTFRVYPADGLATFKVGSTTYNDLNEANSAASSGSNKTIVVARDGVLLPGNYTISSGVTLYIPYNTSETTLTVPAYTKFDAPSAVTALSCYRKLTLLEGANITVNSGGAICVGGQIASLGGGYPSGYPFGACGVLDMSNGGHIELNGTLYAWGFVKGQDMDQGNNTIGVGTITANANSKVYEDFCGENRGGSACSALANDGISYKSFPFQGYAIQNIEVPVTYKYQSTLQVYTALYIQGDIKKDFPLISSSGSLFLVQNNTSQVRKWYDPTTDLACYELSGTAKLDAINTTIYVSVNSANFNLPISSNMHIILDNCTMELSNPVQILPDAVIEIKANSTATVSSNLFLYDVDDWWQGIGAYYFASFKNLTTHKNRGDGTSKANLNDAKLIVDGTLNVTGKLYSTSGGANICGNGGGTITFSSLPTASNIYQCWGAVNGKETYNGVAAVKTFSSWTGGKTYLHSVAVDAANLHNENDAYTKSIANTTFHNIHGRWFVADDKDPKADHTYSFTYLDNGNAGSNANTPAVYSSSKTELKGGYKWVNVALDNTFCGSATYLGIDEHYYYYNSASADAVSKWVQLVKQTDVLYSGSDNNIYTFTTNNCMWASMGEIDESCMYTINGVKKAVVGTELVELEKDEYDEVYVKVTDHSDYYMAFEGCVWQHATKIPDTYKAYEVLGNPYIWLNDEWTQVAEEYGYYYTTDDQNVKHYYEFDDLTFTWKPAKARVRITTPAGDRKDVITWDMAMAYLNQYTNPTVTLLDDAIATQQVTTLAPGSKSTEFTFDFAGHTLTANIGTNAYFMNMSTTATLYITDSSDKQNGQMLIYGAGNKVQYGLKVAKGNVVMNGGRIYMENGAVYASNTSCQTRAIHLDAGQTLTINGGEIEAKGHRNVFGVLAASSAATAATSKVTMNGGKIIATAPNYAYGIQSYGIINMNGGTIDAKTAAVTTTNGTTNAGSYAYGIYGHAYVSAVDASSYYSTINMTGGTVNAKAYSSYAYGVFGYSIYTTANGKKSDGTSDNSYKSTDGTYSNKASCKLNITGGTINAIAERSSQSYGIYSAGTFNSYKDNNTITPHVIKNVKVFAQATANAYGILMSAQTHQYSGGLLWGEAIITNADVYAETTVSTNAYAVYASAANIWSNRVRYSKLSASDKKTWYVAANDNDGDITHEAIAATTTQVYQYQIGWHVAGAKVTINSGTYRAKSANSTSAYAVFCNRSVCPGDPTGNTAGMAEVTINGGTFSAETMTDTGYGISNGGITTVNGGTINVTTGTSTAYGVYGWGGTLTLNSGVVINSTVTTTTAYGVAANGWISTDLGLHTHGTVIVNEGVTVNVTSPNSSTAYGAYALATSAELNQTKYNARSDANKKEYYAVNEEGTTVTNGTTANYYPYRFGTYVEGGEITINGGTFNVTTFGSTAIGAGTSLSNLVRTTELGRLKVGRGVLNVHGGTFNVESQTSTTAEGIRSYGITNIDGGTFNLQTKTTTAYGVCVRDGKTTIDGGTFNVTAGTNTAVGVSAWADDFNTDYGFYYAGELEVNGGTFNVKTWNGSDAYGVQVRGKTSSFAAAKVKIDGVADTKKNYAIAGTATINGGTFIMTPSNGTKAYSTHVYATQTLGTGEGAATAYPTCYIKGGFFQTNGTTTSGMYVSALKENNVVTGGHFSDNTGLTSTTATKNYVNDPYHVLNCVHPDYKDTYPYEVAEAYTITFKDDEGNTLWSGLQPKESVAVYPLTNGIPEKAATETNSFEFASWDKTLATVTEDATYAASFTAVAKKFMVTWKDDAGNEIDHAEYASGQTPTHADPLKEGYTFTGWTPAVTAVAAADQVYTAQFTINQYTIRFEDEDGTLLKEQVVNHGTTPTKPSNPTKEGYSFSAWNPGIVKATEDVTYTATYLLNIASVTTSAGKTTNYTAWSSALSAANGAENSTLTLLTDVGGLGAQSVTQTFTLDLNGHTLSGAVNKLINVNKAGKTLTIRDSQGGGKIATKSATTQLVAVYVTAGTLNIESGHIIAENTYAAENTSYYGCGVLVSSGYACNMSGGTVEGITNIDLAYGLYNNGGTVTITGGTINAQAQKKAYGVHVKGNTTVEHDVVITASTTRTTIADAFYVTAADKTLTINGGVFTANALTTAGYAIEATAAATINVNGGKFKSSEKTVSNTGSATIHLNAGFYDTDSELAGFASPKQVVALTTEPEKAEGYNYKIVDNAHQITFKNEDGSVVLQQSNIEDGVQPVYHGEAQTKASTPKYSYTFDGWKDASDNHVYADAELPVVSEDAVYTAHFAQSGVEYPITFANIDGMGTDYVQMVAYGEVPVYDGATPYMSGAVSNYAYTFIGWDPELTAVTGAATYTPRFDLVISHNVSFVINNASATTPATLAVAEGAAVERPADQLVSCQHIAGWYKDAGFNEEWNFATDKMGESDLILYAKWETKTYTITWLDESGEEIDRTTVNCGAVPTHDALTMPSTASYSYEWKGWNKTLVAANADATYKSLGFTQVPKRYAITFVTGSGATTIDPIELEVGSTVTKPANPTRSGYTFNGWVPAVPGTMPANDVECVAQWTINKYQVTFDSNGGSAVSTIEQDYNTAVTAPADPTREGYTFNGWTPAVPSVMPASNTNCVAQWTINKYQVTFDSNGGSAVSTIEQDYNTTVTAPADPTREGYTFNGWTPAVPSVMPASNTNCVAQWTANTNTAYTVKHYKQQLDGTYATTADETDNLTGTTATEVTPATKVYEGFTAPATQTVTILADGSRVVEYQYTRNSYNLTWNANGGELSGEYTSGLVKYGAAIAAPTATRTNYDFNGWNETPATTMPAQDLTYTAQWTLSAVTILWKSDDGLTTLETDELVIIGTTPSYDGATPVKDATAQYTYTFDGWATEANGAKVYETDGLPDVTAAATYFAHFSSTVNTYIVTIVSNNTDYGTVDAASVENVPYGTMISTSASAINVNGTTVTATKKTDNAQYTYTFDGWINGTETVTGDMTVTANFTRTLNTYTVTWMNGETVLETDENVAYGTTPVYNGATPVKPNDGTYGYSFLGWSPEVEEVTGNATYTAQFVAGFPDLDITAAYELPMTATNTNTVIRETGQMNIPAGRTLTTTNLIIKGTPTTSGQLFTVPANINATNAYYDLTLNTQRRTWYGVGVPWRVDPDQGIFGDGKLLRLGKDFDIIWYNGDTRAKQGPVASCYEYVEDHNEGQNGHIAIEPGRMYFMYFARPYSVIRFAKKTGESIMNEGNVETDRFTEGNADITDHGWNGIANPGLTHVTMPGATPNKGYRYKSVNIDTDEAQWEPVFNLQSETLVVGQPIMVQLPQEGNINLLMDRVSFGPATAPLRRMTADGDIDRAEVLLTSQTGITDRILCEAKDDAEDTYTIGDDLLKFTSGDDKLQMWIRNYDHALAANTVRPENNIATYPLTIISPATGNYKLSLANRLAEGIRLYLTYNGEAIADLTEGEYTLSLGKETNKAYGLRLVRGPRGTVTGIDEAIEGKDNVQKVVMDGVLYIIRQGNVYDASGRLVK